MQEIFKSTETSMQKTIAALDREYKAIRAGRATTAVLDKLSIDYYGTPTPINQLAAVNVPEARTLTIQPWDASVLKLIEKAIQTSDIGINPQNDGKTIRLIFPPLTEEKRREIVKNVHKIGEDSKVALRNVRRDSIDKLKAMKKASEITEDDLKSAEKKLQELTDKYTKEVDSMASVKEKEVMDI